MRQNQFILENFLSNALFRPMAIAMNTNPEFTELYTENPFWFQQVDLRKTRKLTRINQLWTLLLIILPFVLRQ